MTIQIFKRDKKNNARTWQIIKNNYGRKAYYFPLLWKWEVWIVGKNTPEGREAYLDRLFHIRDFSKMKLKYVHSIVEAPKKEPDEYTFSTIYWFPVIDIQFVILIKDPKTGKYLDLNHYDVSFSGVRDMKTGLYLDLDKHDWFILAEFDRRYKEKKNITK